MAEAMKFVIGSGVIRLNPATVMQFVEDALNDRLEAEAQIRVTSMNSKSEGSLENWFEFTIEGVE